MPAVLVTVSRGIAEVTATDDVQVAVVDYDVFDHDLEGDDLARTVRDYITSVEALPHDGKMGIARRNALAEIRKHQPRL